jgi:hypothetical protein
VYEIGAIDFASIDVQEVVSVSVCFGESDHRAASSHGGKGLVREDERRDLPKGCRTR